MNAEDLQSFGDIITPLKDLCCDLCNLFHGTLYVSQVCKHQSCKKCAADDHCRVCNEPTNWIANPLFKKMMASRTVSCTNAAVGCTWTNITFETLAQHQPACTFSKFPCYNKCGWMGAKDEVRDHCLECPKSVVMCSKCCNEYTLCTIDEHTKFC
jgi:hypothetical protein